MPSFHMLAAMFGILVLGIAACYSLLTLLALALWQLHKPSKPCAALPPVTLLKPLCGAEPGLYEHLRGFCLQDYSNYQIVFGMRDADDPARLVVDRLIGEFPHLPIDVAVNPTQHGTNYKVSNLINMLDHARHDYLVMADSDAFVERDYLAIVTAPLLDPAVGMVTCTYRGVPTGSLWSRLGAMYINEWYVPSVLLAWLFGYQGYVSGQTMCLRKDTLRAIGGLRAIADHLADDHRLGEMVSALGLRIVLSPYLVQGEHHEQDYASLARHEIRWMRTLHVLRPMSFRMIFLTFSLPLAAVGFTLASLGSMTGVAGLLLALVAAVRLVFYCVPRIRGRWALLADLWLLPMRDGLLCWIWARSFFTSRVTWRGNEFDVDSNGFLRRLT